MIQWTGTFHSRAYGLLGLFSAVRGEMSVELEPDVQQTTTTTASLTYHGIYKNGQTAHFAVKYDAATGALSGQATASPQILTMRLGSLTEDEITGTYKSEFPGDNGTFVLKRML